MHFYTDMEVHCNFSGLLFAHLPFLCFCIQPLDQNCLFNLNGIYGKKEKKSIKLQDKIIYQCTKWDFQVHNN